MSADEPAHFRITVSFCREQRPAPSNPGNDPYWLAPTGIRETCRILFDVADRHLPSELSLRDSIHDRQVRSVSSGYKTQVWCQYKASTPTSVSTRQQYGVGMLYRKQNTVWASWEMFVQGGRPFLDEILERYRFPDSRSLILDALAGPDMVELYVGDRVCGWLVEQLGDVRLLKCLWLPGKSEIGLLSPQKSLSDMTRNYLGGMKRFALDGIYLEKDLLAACGLKTMDVRKKDPAAIAMSHLASMDR